MPCVYLPGPAPAVTVANRSSSGSSQLHQTSLMKVAVMRRTSSPAGQEKKRKRWSIIGPPANRVTWRARKDQSAAKHR